MSVDIKDVIRMCKHAIHNQPKNPKVTIALPKSDNIKDVTDLKGVKGEIVRETKTSLMIRFDANEILDALTYKGDTK